MKRIIILPLLLVLAITAMVRCGQPKDLQYLSFENMQLKKAGLSESIVTADVKYFNPNHFKLQLKEADFDVFINDKFVGHSRLDTLIHIPANDSFYIPVSVKLNLGDLFKNALQVFTHPDVKVKFEGKAKIGKAGIYKTFPVSYEGTERVDVLLKDTSLSK
jgi:LEA14-like dessication related protein